MNTKAKILAEINEVDDQIYRAQEIINTSYEQKQKLQDTPLRLDNTSRKDALKLAQEQTESIEQLDKNIKISSIAIEGLRAKKNQLETQLKALEEFEKEAERERIRTDVNKLMEKINFQIYQLQKNILPLEKLIEAYNKFYPNNFENIGKRWMNADHIGSFAYTLDAFFLCFYQQNLTFASHVKDSHGLAEGRKNLAKIKEQLEEKYGQSEL